MSTTPSSATREQPPSPSSSSSASLFEFFSWDNSTRRTTTCHATIDNMMKVGGFKRAVFITLCGNSGIGKSMLLVHLLNHLRPDILFGLSQSPFTVGADGSADPTSKGVKAFGPVSISELAALHDIDVSCVYGAGGAVTDDHEVGLFFLDTEGMGVLEDDQMIKLTLIAPALLLSQYRMFVCQHPVNSAIVSDMMTGVRLTSMVNTYNDSISKLLVVDRRACTQENCVSGLPATAQAMKQRILNSLTASEAAILTRMDFQVVGLPDCATAPVGYIASIKGLVTDIMRAVSSAPVNSFVPVAAVAPLCDTLVSAFAAMLQNGDSGVAPTFADVWALVAAQFLTRLNTQALQNREPLMTAAIARLSSAELYARDREDAINREFQNTVTELRALMDASGLSFPPSVVQHSLTELRDRVKTVWNQAHARALEAGTESTCFLGTSFNSITGQHHVPVLNLVPQSGTGDSVVFALIDQRTNTLLGVFHKFVGVNMTNQSIHMDHVHVASNVYACEVGCALSSAQGRSSSIGFNRCSLRFACSNEGLERLFGVRFQGIAMNEFVKVIVSETIHATFTMESGRQFSLTPQVMGFIQAIKESLKLSEDRIKQTVFEFLNAVGDSVLTRVDLGYRQVISETCRNAGNIHNTYDFQSNSQSSSGGGDAFGLNFGRSRTHFAASAHSSETGRHESQNDRLTMNVGTAANPRPLLRRDGSSLSHIANFIQDEAVAAAVIRHTKEWRQQFFFPATIRALRQFDDTITEGQTVTLYLNGDRTKPFRVVVGPNDTAILQGDFPPTTRTVTRHFPDGGYGYVGENDWGQCATLHYQIAVNTVTGQVDGIPLMSCFRKCRIRGDGEALFPNTHATTDVSIQGSFLKFDPVRSDFPVGEPQWLSVEWRDGGQTLALRMRKEHGREEGRTKHGEIITCRPVVFVKHLSDA